MNGNPRDPKDILDELYGDYGMERTPSGEFVPSGPNGKTGRFFNGVAFFGSNYTAGERERIAELEREYEVAVLRRAQELERERWDAAFEAERRCSRRVEQKGPTAGRRDLGALLDALNGNRSLPVRLVCPAGAKSEVLMDIDGASAADGNARLSIRESRHDAVALRSGGETLPGAGTLKASELALRLRQLGLCHTAGVFVESSVAGIDGLGRRFALQEIRIGNGNVLLCCGS